MRKSFAVALIGALVAAGSTVLVVAAPANADINDTTIAPATIVQSSTITISGTRSDANNALWVRLSHTGTGTTVELSDPIDYCDNSTGSDGTIVDFECVYPLTEWPTQPAPAGEDWVVLIDETNDSGPIPGLDAERPFTVLLDPVPPAPGLTNLTVSPSAIYPWTAFTVSGEKGGDTGVLVSVPWSDFFFVPEAVDCTGTGVVDSGLAGGFVDPTLVSPSAAGAWSCPVPAGIISGPFGNVIEITVYEIEGDGTVTPYYLDLTVASTPASVDFSLDGGALQIDIATTDPDDETTVDYRIWSTPDPSDFLASDLSTLGAFSLLTSGGGGGPFAPSIPDAGGWYLVETITLFGGNPMSTRYDFFMVAGVPTIDVFDALPDGTVSFAGTSTPGADLNLTNTDTMNGVCSTVVEADGTWECVTEVLAPGLTTFAAIASAGETSGLPIDDDARYRGGTTSAPSTPVNVTVLEPVVGPDSVMLSPELIYPTTTITVSGVRSQSNVDVEVVVAHPTNGQSVTLTFPQSYCTGTVAGGDTVDWSCEFPLTDWPGGWAPTVIGLYSVTTTELGEGGPIDSGILPMFISTPTPDAAPVISAPSPFYRDSTFTVSGSKPAGAAVNVQLYNVVDDDDTYLMTQPGVCTGVGTWFGYVGDAGTSWSCTYTAMAGELAVSDPDDFRENVISIGYTYGTSNRFLPGALEPELVVADSTPATSWRVTPAGTVLDISSPPVDPSESDFVVAADVYDLPPGGGPAFTCNDVSSEPDVGDVSCSFPALAPGLYAVEVYSLRGGFFNEAPVFEFFGIPAAPSIVTALALDGGSVALQGTSAPNQPIDVFSGPGESLCSTVAGPTGIWGCSTGALPPGDYAFTAVARDTSQLADYVPFSGSFPGGVLRSGVGSAPSAPSALVIVAPPVPPGPPPAPPSPPSTPPVTSLPFVAAPPTIPTNPETPQTLALDSGTDSEQNEQPETLSEPVATEPISEPPVTAPPAGSSDRTDWGGPSWFTDSLPTWQKMLSTPANLLFGSLLALALMLLVAIPSELLNSTIAQNEHRLGRGYGAVQNGFRRANAWFERITRLPVITYGSIILALSVIFGFSDPEYGFDPVSVRMTLATALSIFIVYYVGGRIAGAIIRRIWKVETGIALLPTAIVLAIVGVALARFIELAPGFLIGLAIGLEIVTSVPKKVQARAALVNMGVILGLSLLAYTAYSWVTEAAVMQGTFVGAFTEDALVAITAEGLTGLLIVLLPLAFFDGKDIWDHSKVSWIIAFAIIATLFAAIVLPDSLDEITDLGDLVAWLIPVAIFGAVVLAIWGWLVWRDRVESRAESREKIDA